MICLYLKIPENFVHLILQDGFWVVHIQLVQWRCPWCNCYHRRKWTRRHEFKSWTRLIAFHIALIPLGKVWIQLKIDLVSYLAWAEGVVNIYTTCSYGQISISCTIPSGSPFQPSCVLSYTVFALTCCICLLLLLIFVYFLFTLFVLCTYLFIHSYVNFDFNLFWLVYILSLYFLILCLWFLDLEIYTPSLILSLFIIDIPPGHWPNA